MARSLETADSDDNWRKKSSGPSSDTLGRDERPFNRKYSFEPRRREGDAAVDHGSMKYGIRPVGAGGGRVSSRADDDGNWRSSRTPPNDTENTWNQSSTRDNGREGSGRPAYGYAPRGQVRRATETRCFAEEASQSTGRRPVSIPRCSTEDRARYRQKKMPRDQGHLPLSSDHLKIILRKDPSEAVMEVGLLLKCLDDSLNETTMESDRQRLLFKTLAHICGDASAVQAIPHLLTLIVDSTLLRTHLPRSLVALRALHHTGRDDEDFLQNAISILNSIVQMLPSRASDISVSLTLLMDAITSLERGNACLYFELSNLVDDITNQIKQLDRKRERERQKARVARNPPPDNFRMQPIEPSLDELQPNYQPFLRQNVTKGVYLDADHYQDVQFRLLKEDFVQPLRNGISEYKRSRATGHRKKIQDIRIYKDVRYERSSHKTSGIFHQLSFSKLNGVNWERSKRLMYGSLLLLSCDEFESCIFATVAERDARDLEGGLVTISFVKKVDVSSLLKKTFVMIESSVFFEAYRHVLSALQRTSVAFFPVAKYILDPGLYVDPPMYLRYLVHSRSLQMDISPILRWDGKRHSGYEIEILNDGDWPQVPDVKLDESQLQAVKTALSQEVALIQGPPGTGKTYVGLKIMEILLRNFERLSQGNPGPILLVCFTNHALDQFLEGILKFQSNGIIRVGSRSKNEKMNALNLKRLLFSRKFLEDGLGSSKIEEEVSNVKRDIEMVKFKLQGTKDGIINENELGLHMTTKHWESLMRYQEMQHTDSLLVEWLLCECQLDQDWNRQTLLTPANTDSEMGKAEVSEQRDRNSASMRSYSERRDIEAERMIGVETGCERGKTGQMDPIFGLDLKDLKKHDVQHLRRYILMKMRQDESGKQKFEDIEDVWQMDPKDRWCLYHIWLKKYTEDNKRLLKGYEMKFTQLCSKLEEIKDVEKFHALRESVVIGMTTTGAAKHKYLLERVKPKIVVVEEAAEVLEAHIITSLSAACQQLILIGDHKQLRPKPNVYMLAKKYKLDVSLFERMISNDFPCTQLELQHRMRPEISHIMKTIFYDNLDDNDEVKSYESIMGITKNMFFLDHDKTETFMEETQSYINLHEVTFLLALCYYLLQQGYEPKQITILTTYTAQLIYILQMADRERMGDVRVASVDNFQGEESDIILLSFVRSNQEGEIGFLGIPNRVCVSLSRAKKGLYCIGNFSMFARKSELWKTILDKMEVKGSVGKVLPLECTNHTQQITMVASSKDFTDNVPEGGCMKPCDARLYCGHVCRMKCHPRNRNHAKCQEPCKKIICAMDHKCPAICSETCPHSCPKIVKVILSCGHLCSIECSERNSPPPCNEEVLKMLSCSHEILIKCHRSVQGLESECQVLVQKRLGCGHLKTEKCSDNGLCEVAVSKQLPCHHTCIAECFKETSDILCEEQVHKTLPCGHVHLLACHQDVTNVQCDVFTSKRRDCGHTVMESCFKTSMCQEEMKKRLNCGHQKIMTCSADITLVKCDKPCQEQLPCGHVCRGKCGETCIEECMELVNRDDWPCGHKVQVRCSASPDSCYEKCSASLMCGHNCRGTCGECLRGRFHLPCMKVCNKKLLCGHECPLKCGVPCQPCFKKCRRRCPHGKCDHPCDVQCEACMKRCNWRCAHERCTNLCFEPCNRPGCNESCPKTRKCGHPCIGLCGEICPNKCWECDKAELQARFDDVEDKETARYIQLEDCGHVFEVSWLDEHLGLNTKTMQTFSQQSEKMCPTCKKTILLSRRYGNLIKTSASICQKVLDRFQSQQEELHERKGGLGIKDAMRFATRTLSVELPGKWDSVGDDITQASSLTSVSLRIHLLEEVRKFFSACLGYPREKSLACQLVRKIMGDTKALSNQEIVDILTELRRFEIYQAIQRISNYTNIDLLKGTVNDVIAILLEDSRLTLDGPLKRRMRENVRYSTLSSLCQAVELPVRLTFSHDAWQMCSSGHVLMHSECRNGEPCTECFQPKTKPDHDSDESDEDGPTIDGAIGDDKTDESVNADNQQGKRKRRRRRKPKRNRGRSKRKNDFSKYAK